MDNPSLGTFGFSLWLPFMERCRISNDQPPYETSNCVGSDLGSRCAVTQDIWWWRPPCGRLRLAIGQFAHNHATAMTVSTGPKIGVNAGGRARRYSGRSVTAGSTNAARRAGKRHAASAPARIIVMTVA